MSSADMNHPVNSGVWPDDPYGDMTPILEASVEEAKQRHPSGKAGADDVADVLTSADRCDDCGAGALYLLRSAKSNRELALCHHHGHKYGSAMSGWSIVGQNLGLMRELYSTDRLKGSDHA